MSALGETCRTAVAPVGELLASMILAAAKGTASCMRIVGDMTDSFGRIVSHRRVISQLAEFDDRMLRDIGLNRADLRDAASVPLAHDPTDMLVLRATERRAATSLRRLKREPQRPVLHIVR